MPEETKEAPEVEAEKAEAAKEKAADKAEAKAKAAAAEAAREDAKGKYRTALLTGTPRDYPWGGSEEVLSAAERKEVADALDAEFDAQVL